MFQVIDTTWENLQITEHKSVKRSFHTSAWFVLCNLIADYLEVTLASHLEQPHTLSTFSISNRFLIFIIWFTFFFCCKKFKVNFCLILTKGESTVLRSSSGPQWWPFETCGTKSTWISNYSSSHSRIYLRQNVSHTAGRVPTDPTTLSCSWDNRSGRGETECARMTRTQSEREREREKRRDRETEREKQEESCCKKCLGVKKSTLGKKATNCCFWYHVSNLGTQGVIFQYFVDCLQVSPREFH